MYEGMGNLRKHRFKTPDYPCLNAKIKEYSLCL